MRLPEFAGVGVHTSCGDGSSESASEAWPPVKRLISGAPRVHFVDGPSGGWADKGYSLTEGQRKAELKLGRKLVKRA